MNAKDILEAKELADNMCETLFISDQDKYLMFGDINTPDDIDKVKLFKSMYTYLFLAYNNSYNIADYIKMPNKGEFLSGFRVMDVFIYGDVRDVCDYLKFLCDIKTTVDYALAPLPPISGFQTPSS